MEQTVKFDKESMASFKTTHIQWFHKLHDQVQSIRNFNGSHNYTQLDFLC